MEAATSSLGDRNIRIGTADRFQGLEASIVVVSLVKSQTPVLPSGTTDHQNALDHESIGFMTCAQRTNSMITRAKNLLIFIGSLTLFKHSKSDGWEHITNNVEVRKVMGRWNDKVK
jgi:superfamily I DNA and/or RNA helicase